MANIIKFKLNHDNAVLPTREGIYEVGFDLTIISKIKDIDPYTSIYDTGVCVEPPDNYYFEVVPRSSLYKLGYVLSNSIGIIDPSYRGTIKIALTKINKQAPDIELPNKRFQLIPREFLSNIFTLSLVEELSDTYRGEGSFGSTDKNN